MRITFDGDKLARQMQVRGLTARALAEAAGVSTPTVSAGLHGRALNVISAVAIAQAIKAIPVIESLDALVVEIDEAAKPGPLASYIETATSESVAVEEEQRASAVL